MKIRELLARGRAILTEADNSDTVNLDSSLLLAHVLNIGREKLFAMLNDPVPPEAVRDFLDLIDKRSRLYPVAYLTGSREFFGRDFAVEQGILCPRPDTEIIVEKALELSRDAGCLKVLDLCSGSGCIGLTMALEKPDFTVICADIDMGPERMFQRNKADLGVENADFIRSDLFDSIAGSFDMIMTNPPYLTTKETDERMDEGWKEPALALDGGDDGLDLIRKIIPKSIDYLSREGYLLIEAAPPQMGALENLMKKSGFSETGTAADLAGRQRVIYGRRGN